MELDRKHIKILVIDDEPGIQNLLDYVLKLEGYTVVTASNGEEGLEAFKNDKFQLVITDVKMPKVDGLQVLDVVKTTSPDTEIIMITGFGTVSAAVQAIRKGAYDFIQKPFNLEEMLSLIAKALEKAELRALIAFHDISKAIFSIVSLHDLLPALADLSLKLLHADDVSLFLLKDDGTLECAVSRGLKTSCAFRIDLARNVIEKSRTPAEECVVAGPGEATQAMNDAALSAGIQSFLIAPLSSNGKLLGAWCACRTATPEPFSRNEEDYANIFVAQVSQAIYNAQLYAELSAQADTLDAARTQLTAAKQELAHRERLATIARITPPLPQRVTQLLAGLSADGPGAELPALKERLARVHGMLTNLSRFVTPTVTETAVNLNEVIAQSLELLDCSPGSKPAVTVTYDTALQPLTADFSQMEQVILELVSFLRARLAHTPEAAITIATRELSNRVQIEFTDNGPVLTPHGEDDFFALAAHAPEGAHVPAVREIISKYNGCMTVHNRQEGQTVFSLEFPRH